MKEELTAMTGKAIVVDTCSNWVYLGILDRVTDHCLILSSVDAHDISDTEVSKEFYIFDSKRNGIKANRDRVYINREHVVGFSSFESVREF